MTQATEQKIRERAYQIWVATGCESGLAELHWLSAEQAVMDEEAQPGARIAGKAAAKSAKKAGSRSALPATVAVRKRAKKVAQA